MKLRTSDSINELATALAIAQGQIEPADKDGKSHQAKYATLLSVREISRNALAKNDLSIIQAPFFEEGRVGVVTRLMHKTGQWIETEISIKVMKDDAHSIGSAITYGRRYGMSAILGIVADDDDDANLAMGNNQQKQKPHQQAQQQQQVFNSNNPKHREWALQKLDELNMGEEQKQKFLAEIHGSTLEHVKEELNKLRD
jgi:hypothetical protein